MEGDIKQSSHVKANGYFKSPFFIVSSLYQKERNTEQRQKGRREFAEKGEVLFLRTTALISDLLYQSCCFFLVGKMASFTESSGCIIFCMPDFIKEWKPDGKGHMCYFTCRATCICIWSRFWYEVFKSSDLSYINNSGVTKGRCVKLLCI